MSKEEGTVADHKQSGTPDAPVWKALHEYHAAVAASVNANQFKEISSHVGTITELADKRVTLAPADQKTIVVDGVN